MQGQKTDSHFRHNILTLPPQTTGLVLTNEPGIIKGGFNGVAAQYTQPLSYLVVWKPNGIPALPSDGQSLTITANGSAIYSFTIPGLTNGVSYGVRIFVRGRFGFQTSPEAQGTMTPVAGVQIDSKAVGTRIRISIGGVAYSWLIVQIGRPSSMYDVSCDDVWLLLEKIYSNRVWDAGSINDYAASDINIWLNGDFISLIEAAVRGQIKQVKIPYAANSGANGLSVRSFLLSANEVGFLVTPNTSYPNDGALLNYFSYGENSEQNSKRIAYLNGSASHWWVRSAQTRNNSSGYLVMKDGTPNGVGISTTTWGVRPCIIVPRTLMISAAANSDGSFSPI